MSKVTSDGVVQRAIFCLLEDMNSSKTLAAAISLRYGSESLFETSLRAADYADSTKFALDYLSSEFLSKVRDLDFGIEKDRVAFAKWKLAEEKCHETNKYFREFRLRPTPGRVQSVIFDAQRKIAAILGPLKVSLMLDWCKWGPGATFDLRRSEASVEKKITALPLTVTAHAMKYARSVIESDPVWFEAISGIRPEGNYSVLPSCFGVVSGNRIIFVPKNAKTDRTISAEPTMNSFLQQGVGRYLRRRLMRFGVNLDDQTINQLLARDGVARELATIDLSMASDTICTELIYELLPIDWAIFLDDLRSKATRLKDGSWHPLSKFSSMGNAFTFELESLIFFALSSSALRYSDCSSEPVVSVYGDDIICPTSACPLLFEVLNFCGFSVNDEKSHLSGPFRESCGKHFFDGIDVTPFYQRLVATREPNEVVRFANRLVRFSLRIFGEWRHPLFRRCWKALFESIPNPPMVPLGTEGDDGFIVPRPFLKHTHFCPSMGYRCRVLVASGPKAIEGKTSHYAYWLRRRHNEPSFSLEPRVTGSHVRYAYKRRWLPPVWEVAA